MPLCRYAQIKANILFNDRLTSPGCYRGDKLATFRTLWEKWVACLPLLLNPGTDVRVDKLLLAFRGRCEFQQCMPNKPTMYGIKI